MNNGQDAETNDESSISTEDFEDFQQLETVTSATLIEVTAGVVAVFGDVPDGLEPLDLSLIPNFDRDLIAASVGVLGNSGTVVGNAVEAVSSMQGLYRVNDATLKLLKGGAELAGKDGAKIGALFQNGKIVGQARFMPAGLTAAGAVAAIGPAIAMLALQMQLGEISGLVRTNIELTSQTLRSIRAQQWAELEGVVGTIDNALEQVHEVGAVPQTVWDKIAPIEQDCRKQVELYQDNVRRHVKELQKHRDTARRQFLETNAEAIVFDVFAMLNSLKAYASYQAIHASKARVNSIQDESEGRLFDRIMHKTPQEVAESMGEIRSLVGAVTRELRIIAELPGRAMLPLTKKRRDSKTSQLTCGHLLKVLTPISNSLHAHKPTFEVPEIVCGPVDLDLLPYLKVLRWFLEDGEKVRAIAFPYAVSKHNLTGLIPKVLGARVDSTWDALGQGVKANAIAAVASGEFVCVSDRRLIVTSPRALVREGSITDLYSSSDIKFIRAPELRADSARRTLEVVTLDRDLKWLFPAAAPAEQIQSLATLINELAQSTTQDELEASVQTAEESTA